MARTIMQLLGVITCCNFANALPEIDAGRKLLQDYEGFSVDAITPYLVYIANKCGDPSTVKGKCDAIKQKFCGTRDTSEVLCCGAKDPCALPDKKPVARFRSASRYTRVGYLQCSLTAPNCTTENEGFTGSWWQGPGGPPAAGIDPKSLDRYNAYVSCRTVNNELDKPVKCTLPTDLCKRPDVKCEGQKVTFYDIKNLKAKRAIFVATPEKWWLLQFVRQPPTKGK